MISRITMAALIILLAYGSGFVISMVIYVWCLGQELKDAVRKSIGWPVSPLKCLKRKRKQHDSE